MEEIVQTDKEQLKHEEGITEETLQNILKDVQKELYPYLMNIVRWFQETQLQFGTFQNDQKIKELVKQRVIDGYFINIEEIEKRVLIQYQIDWNNYKDYIGVDGDLNKNVVDLKQSIVESIEQSYLGKVIEPKGINSKVTLEQNKVLELKQNIFTSQYEITKQFLDNRDTKIKRVDEIQFSAALMKEIIVANQNIFEKAGLQLSQEPALYIYNYYCSMYQQYNADNFVKKVHQLNAEYNQNFQEMIVEHMGLND